MRPSKICLVVFAWLSAARVMAQEVPETREYSRRGERSVGAEAPSQATMLAAIQTGSPEKLRATLEYGERVLCSACVAPLEQKLLASESARVREISAWWLRRQPFAAPAILARLVILAREDPDPRRRGRALSALGEFMDPHALTTLQAAAQRDGDAQVRSQAVRALSRLNDAGAAPTIAAALADPAREVRAAALDVLLTSYGFRDFTAMLPLLADPDLALRAQAARIAGELRLAAAEAALGAMLVGDAAPSARKAAAWALGRIGAASGRALLQQQRSRERDPLVLSAIAVAERMAPSTR